MATELIAGSLQQVRDAGAVETAVALKVTDLEDNNGKLKCKFSDGKENMPGVLTSQVMRQFGSTLKSNDIVKVTEANVNVLPDNRHVLIVAAMEVVGSAPADDETAAEPEAKKQKVEEEAVAMDTAPVVEAKTPAAALKTTGDAPKTGPTPPSGPYNAPTTASKRNVQPISSLNPYNHGWAIRAKIVSKGTKRTFGADKGNPGSVFTAEIVDEHGTAIEATFWKGAADRCYDMLEDGKVYIFAKGSVKPANKKYSQVRNDYALHFYDTADISASDVEIDTTGMTAKMQFVPIDQLAAFVDKKTLVDIIGVVTTVAPLGSVKRKADNADLARRDVTVVDTAARSVTVTLWGSAAEGVGQTLEDSINANGRGSVVIAISSCRVSSYNGVSVSAVTRSQFLIDPVDQFATEVQALKSWWEETGNTANISAVGEGISSAAKTNAAKANQRVTLEAFKDTAPTNPADKPVYASVIATFTGINSERNMWYEACPENNRKVTAQGDGTWLCEYDGKVYPSMTRRYIITTPIVDCTGETYAQVFNDHADVLIGRNADELAELKNKDEDQFNAVLANVAWTEWMIRLKAQAQEYNGETRTRYAVADIKPVDYVMESRRMLEAMNAVTVA